MARYLFIMAQEGHRWGGSEPLWSEAAERLARAGNEVRISAKEWEKPVPEVERLRSVGCTIFYRPPYRIPPFPVRLYRRIFPPAPFVKSHMDEVGRGVDLVVISSPDNGTGLEWMEAAREAGHKYAVIAQTALVFWWPDDDRAERLAEAYEQASGAYFVSQAILDISRWQFGTSLLHGTVVRNPFNVGYDACPPWPTNAGAELALACVARLDVVSKSHDVLLQTLALPKWRSRSVRLSLVGAGPHERILRRMAATLRLSNVEFCGHGDDIERVWAQHHALVLASRFEGMPLVVVEAMLCGRPCIATDVGGNRELIRDGINGFLAKAATVELLDEALERAWQERARLADMGRVAASDVRRWVSPDPGGDLARDLELLAAGASREAAGSLVSGGGKKGAGSARAGGR